ncbi:MAG: cation-translocating P-type ATPase [Rhizobiaceae bacterium]
MSNDIRINERNGFHAIGPDEAITTSATNAATGLTLEEAERRLGVYGANVLLEHKPTSLGRLVFHQFESAIVWLLLIAAVVAFVFGEWTEGSAVLVVLVINGSIGFATEWRAVRSMEALRALGSITTRVRRDGRSVMIPAESLVPGDIVLLEGGDVVTADLRLVNVANLAIDESALTGESVPVSKSVEPIAGDAVIAERTCMAFKGTAVIRGTGSGVVVATGMSSELGHISRLVEEATAEQSPLEQQLKRLSGQLIWFTLAVVMLIGITGVFAGRDFYLMVESAIALAVAAIPEGLPIVATMALARGMWRMARQNARIERLSAVETLGSTTVIFTDKTGTLTENRMRLREIELSDTLLDLDHEDRTFRENDDPITPDSISFLPETLEALVLCNNAELDTEHERHTGDPLEIALLEAGLLAGVSQKELEQQYPRINETAFSADSRMMATVHRDSSRYLVCVKGAPEALLEKAGFVADGTELDTETRDQWLHRTEAMAARGMRVLAVARKHVSDDVDDPYCALCFLGLLGLYDPPRNDVPAAIQQCLQAGVRVVIITGDHAVTAKSIATDIGLTDDSIEVIEGRNLAPLPAMSPHDLAQIRAADVFARVNPAQKLDLVSMFQKNGEIVAMTGDGVNDAPALKKADIGIAMGIRGTPVAKEAAAMVLRDDAFKTIVTAIREGRMIFRNIQRFVMYLLSCNLSEVLVVGLAIFIGLPLPLLPLQILFLNFVTDVFPAFALGLGEEDGHVLSVPPRDPQKPIVTRPMWVELVFHSVLITASTLAALAIAIWVLLMEREAAITVSFLTLAFAQLWHVFNMRDPRSRLLSNSITRNPFVWGAVALSGGMLLAVVYIPAFSAVLQMQVPDAQAWGLILIASIVPLLLGQIGKVASRYIYRSRKLHDEKKRT